MRLSSLLLLFLMSNQIYSQSFSGDFPSAACHSENILIRNNLSNDIAKVEWDFCEGDLHESNLTVTSKDSNLQLPIGTYLVEANGKWYGFLCDRGSNKLYRMDFGVDITNKSPEIIDLGNLGNNLNQPQSIKVIQYESNYLGFIYNLGSNALVRINFGSNIESISVDSSILSTEMGFGNGGLDIAFDGNEWVVALSYSNTLKLFALGNSPLNDVVGSIMTSPIQGVENIGDIKFVSENDNWFAFVCGYSSQSFHRLSFGNDLFSDPISQKIAVTIPFIPYGLSVERDRGEWILFSTTLFGNIVRLNFGSSIENINPDYDDLGTFDKLFNTLKVDFARAGSKWIALTTRYDTKEYFIIEFPDIICPFNISSSSNLDTLTIKASSIGQFFVSRYLDYLNGGFEIQLKQIQVLDKYAPFIELDFTKCFGFTTDLEVLSSDVLLSTNWDLNNDWLSDANGYTTSFLFPFKNNKISLQVTAENGCNNYIEKPIKIYDQPVASFSLPPGLICTNNEFTFVNNTVDNFDGNLTYEWLVNDVLESTARDFNYAFTAGGDQQVKLKTSIPGCSDELTQTLLNVQPGPVVDFSFTGKCEDEEIVFTNESSGSVSGYLWNFGNGNTSTDVSPSETYATNGNYDVLLTTTGMNGCESKLIKPVAIYSVPQTNFSIDLPPFSCAGSASQFNDLTPPMPDSNITSWAWSFDDPSNGSSSQKNPLYTYSLAGDYSVALSTTTNFGCSNSIQKTVAIFPSPSADFSFGPACVNQETQFTDLSIGDIKSWLWSIQSNTYTSPNPKHIFKSASAYNALLTVTGNNGCISQATKSVNVPLPVSPDFSSSSTCANKPSVFDEVTKGGVDPASSWTWSFANQGSGTGSPTEHIFSSTGNYSVTLNSTRQSGCTYSITKTIPITDSPKAQFNMFLESGAAPFTVNLTNASTKATKYVWKPGDPKQSSSTAFVPSFTYVDLGDYAIELEASNELGCKDYMQQLVHVVIPQINAAVSDFRLEVIPGSDHYSPVVTIENKSNVALVNPIINLDLSGNATVSQTIEAIIRPNELLPYRFTTNISPVSLSFACAEINVSADDYAFDNRQCVNLQDEYSSMIPYPNPASHELILEWINNHDEPMEMVIYNAAGRAVISRQYAPTLKGLNQVKLDVSALSAGIYFVSYSLDGLTQNFRFSIVR